VGRGRKKGELSDVLDKAVFDLSLFGSKVRLCVLALI